MAGALMFIGTQVSAENIMTWTCILILNEKERFEIVPLDLLDCTISGGDEEIPRTCGGAKSDGIFMLVLLCEMLLIHDVMNEAINESDIAASNVGRTTIGVELESSIIYE